MDDVDDVDRLAWEVVYARSKGESVWRMSWKHSSLSGKRNACNWNLEIHQIESYESNGK